VPETLTHAALAGTPAINKKRGPMTHCILAKQCDFFAVRDEGKEMREYFTGLYCAGNFNDCARYRAALEIGQDLVPDDIFPNEDAFRSLFAWSVTRRKTPAVKPCRSHFPGGLPICAPEKIPASSDHLPATRQTRRQS